MKFISGLVNRRGGKFGIQRGLGNYSQDGLEMEEFPKFQRWATQSGWLAVFVTKSAKFPFVIPLSFNVIEPNVICWLQYYGGKIGQKKA